jgi:hypothetical protein
MKIADIKQSTRPLQGAPSGTVLRENKFISRTLYEDNKTCGLGLFLVYLIASLETVLASIRTVYEGQGRHQLNEINLTCRSLLSNNNEDSLGRSVFFQTTAVLTPVVASNRLQGRHQMDRNSNSRILLSHNDEDADSLGRSLFFQPTVIITPVLRSNRLQRTKPRTDEPDTVASQDTTTLGLVQHCTVHPKTQETVTVKRSARLNGCSD